MFEIHGFMQELSFNTNKVLYVAEALKADYKFHNLDFAKGEHKSAEHLKRHPLGKTPTLMHGDKTLFESGAICKYMASVQGSNLYPVEDHYKRALVDQWMDFFTSHIGRWSSVALFENFFKQMMGGGPKDEKNYNEALDFFTQQASMLNTHFENNKFLCGHEITVADIFAFAYLETATASGLPISDFPQLNSWVNAMRDQSFIGAVKSRYYSK